MARKVLIILVLAFIYSGCSKEENTSVNYNYYITAGEEYVMFQNVVHENLKWIYRATRVADFEDDNRDTIRSVQVIKELDEGDSSVYTLDYTVSWFDYDGVHKDSTITLSVKGDMRTEGDRAHLNFEGFSFEERQLKGQLTYRHRGTEDGLDVIDVSSRGFGFSDTLGRTHDIYIDQQLKIKNYFSVLGNIKFRFQTSGMAEGTASNFKKYTASITDTAVLRDSLACTRVKKGTVILGIENSEANGTTYIQFGEGSLDTCSNKYRISFDDEKYDLSKNQ